MLSPEDQKKLFEKAYVPEHSAELMAMLSGGEPLLFEDYFCCQTQYGIIVVGYPLEGGFELDRFEKTLERIIKVFQPVNLSLIAPETPQSFVKACVERSTDSYYTLNLPALAPSGTLGRMVRKAKEAGTVERSSQLTQVHRTLAQEFVTRAAPPPRIRELLFRMWDYVGIAEGAAVANVWDRQGRLAAFFVIDCAPKDFVTYVIGCHSKTNNISGASDLLVADMIALGTDLGKRFIHLGIGVNPGIRAFKEKWGGMPTIPYELCELTFRKASLMDSILGAVGLT